MFQLSSASRTLANLIEQIPGGYVEQDDLETTISNLAMRTVLYAAVTLITLTIIAMLFSQKREKLKLPLFVMMSLVMAGSTLTLIISTVYLNVRSDSGGPVHWHADVEFWACGNELEFRDPTGFLSNKIGTATLHEHDDHRIHLEGVVVDDRFDATLGKYMFVTGGAITAEQMVVPLNADGEGNLFEDEEDGDGVAAPNPELVDPFIIDDEELGKIAYFKDGDSCGGEVSDVQVFVYNYNGDTKTYEQTKLDNPVDYVITDDPNVPPGDCIIFEFGPEREKTDKLCAQYGIRDIERCEQFGVEPDQREICELTQTNFSADMTLPTNNNEEGVDRNEDEVGESFETETTESIEGAVHLDPTTESARIACDESREGLAENAETEACNVYSALLENNPGALEELTNAAEATEETDADTETETTEGGAN